MNKKVLVLGNGVQVNNIKFNKLNKDIITLGVNRIWLKHYPNYFFFHDIDILNELNNSPIEKAKLISNSICYSSDWINKSNCKTPLWVRKYPRPNRRRFPCSVSTSIDIFGRNIIKGRLSEYTFYLAGVNLKWKEPSHFWKEEKLKGVGNKFDKKWYDHRFSKMLENIRSLKSVGFNMISVTPDSNLSKIIRYENIENLYD